MKIYFIRHGKTYGNVMKRYIGKTDEQLCESGIKELEKLSFQKSELLICSPMKRCIQTAEILFPAQKYVICDSLRECDFGDFEGKNYIELSENNYYQSWIDSGGILPFPNGESTLSFKNRCTDGFKEIVKQYADMNSISFVVHGGTIMSILSKFSVLNFDYFEWHCENGHGYSCDWNGKKLTDTERI